MSFQFKKRNGSNGTFHSDTYAGPNPIGPNVNLSGVNLSGLDLSEADLANVDLTGANLRGANLTGANLADSDLTGSNLSGIGLSLFGANLTNANLTGAKTAHIIGNPILSTGYSIINNIIIGPGVNLSGVNLSGLILSGKNLTDVNLQNANLQTANLTSANLTGADLRGANLFGTNLTSANLTETKTDVVIGNPTLPTGYSIVNNSIVGPGVNLSGSTRLSGVNLSGVNLSGADLTGVNLSGSDLTGANLTAANLLGGTLTNANLTNAILARAWITKSWNALHLKKDSLAPQSLPSSHTFLDATFNWDDNEDRPFLVSSSNNVPSIVRYVDQGGSIRTAQLNGHHNNQTDSSKSIRDIDILPNTTLRNMNFFGRDFHDADFSGIRFENCTFENTNFTNANFTSCIFDKSEVKFKNCVGLDTANFSGSLFTMNVKFMWGVVFDPSKFSNAIFNIGLEILGASISKSFNNVNVSIPNENFLNGVDENFNNLVSTYMYYDLSTEILTSKYITYTKKDGSFGTHYRGTTNIPSKNITPGVNLSGIDLGNIILTDADLTGSDLTGTNLSGATITGVKAIAIIGSPTLPTGFSVIKNNIVGPGADLTGADLTGIDLTNAILSGANLSGANLSGATITGAKTTAVVGSPTLPYGFSIINQNIVGPGVDLSGVDLNNENLSGVDLTGVNLSAANLSYTNLSGADLTLANLSGANLAETNLSGTKLFSTVLTDAFIANTNFSNAKHNFVNEISVIYPQSQAAAPLSTYFLATNELVQFGAHQGLRTKITPVLTIPNCRYEALIDGEPNAHITKIEIVNGSKSYPFGRISSTRWSIIAAQPFTFDYFLRITLQNGSVKNIKNDGGNNFPKEEQLDVVFEIEKESLTLQRHLSFSWQGLQFNHDIGQWGGGNLNFNFLYGEYQTYKGNESIIVQGDSLKILAKRENGGDIISARAHAISENFSVRKDEVLSINILAKLPKSNVSGVPLQPTIMLMGKEFFEGESTRVDWPTNGQIDIMQHLHTNGNDKYVNGMHYTHNINLNNEHISNTVSKSGLDLTDKLYKYGVEIVRHAFDKTKNKIRFLFEDSLVKEYFYDTRYVKLFENVSDPNAAKEFALVLSLAVGGIYTGHTDNIGSIPDFSAEMEIKDITVSNISYSKSYQDVKGPYKLLKRIYFDGSGGSPSTVDANLGFALEPGVVIDSHVDITNLNLVRSNLSGVNFSPGADLTTVQLDFANMSGTDLNGVTLGFQGEIKLDVNSTTPLNIPSGYKFIEYNGEKILSSASLPIDIGLNSSDVSGVSLGDPVFDEKISPDSVVGYLYTQDQDSSRHDYSLVSGSGDNDNSSFSIDGNKVIIDHKPLYNVKNTYNIRIKSVDITGNAFEKSFNLKVNRKLQYTERIKQLGAALTDWEPIKNGDIDGTDAGSNSGHSVALSNNGMRVVIGAPSYGNGWKQGQVRVYDYDINMNTWSQVGSEITGEHAYAEAGYRVAISGDGSRIAFSAIGYGNAYENQSAGRVKVFDWNGTSWVQVGQGIIGEVRLDKSGESFSMSKDGSTVAIGSTENTVGHTGDNKGHVRIFKLIDTNWTQLGTDIDGQIANDKLGSSVALSADGKRVVIGIKNKTGVNGAYSGRVKVYDWNGSSWIQVGGNIDGAYVSQAGHRVAISSNGNRIGISYANVDSGRGQVSVFQWDGSSWNQLGANILGEAQGDYFGESLSMSSDGDKLVVGADFNQGVNGAYSGHARMYKWNGSTWLPYGNDIDGEHYYDRSGFSVAISGDGNIIAVGAIDNDGESGDFNDNRGHVRVYRKRDLSFSPPTGYNLGDINSGADLSGADLYGVDLTSADLTNVNFTNANLRNIKLNDSILDNANFSGAHLNFTIYDMVLNSKSNSPINLPLGYSFYKIPNFAWIRRSNLPSTNLTLSHNLIPENFPAPFPVATISTEDPDSNTFTYSFIGGADDDKFDISGDKLYINVMPDFEAKPQYNIKIKTTDESGNTREKDFTINVLDLYYTSINTTSFSEYTAVGSVIATLSSSDIVDPASYSFVSGYGSDDNGSFTISNNQILLNTVPDRLTKSSYTTRICTINTCLILDTNNYSFSVS